MIRSALAAIAYPLAWCVARLKVFAWGTGPRWAKGLLLELTGAFDLLLVPLLTQNGALAVTWRAFGRKDFIFGRTVMRIDHAAACEALPRAQLRGSRFMGLPIVGFESSAFMTNAGPINASHPARGVLRRHLDTAELADHHRHPDVDRLRSEAQAALDDWMDDPRWWTLWSTRGAVTRVLARYVGGVEVPKADADAITAAYLRRFAELSAFGYLPVILGILGTREAIRREAFLPLSRFGLNPLVVDMILFAGMFSVGTAVLHAVGLCRRLDIDYGVLDDAGRDAFVLELYRYHPTVSSVHRVVEAPETVALLGKRVALEPGEEVAYPFYCINRDAGVFEDPERFRLDRPPRETSQVLSWSRGPHVCPVQDLSLALTRVFLDTMQTRQGDLRRLRVLAFEV